MEDEKTYLGDGLYISYDGYQFRLSTKRKNGEHFVCLEPTVFERFQSFVQKTWAEERSKTE